MYKIGFIGVGNMGTAILKGIAGSAMKSQVSLFAFDPSEERVDALAEYGVQRCASEAEAAASCKYLFLAIKPQMFDAVLPKIAQAITEETVLVSIAAGMGVDYIRRLTKPYAKVILVMPNTPLLLREGATALSKEDSVTDAEFAVVREIFDACGKTAVLSTDQMKEIITINSSSPAFIYLFAKGFLDYAAEVGLPVDTAKTLFAQALVGSAKMMTDSGFEIDELIRQVSSPGGTTLAGLDRFYAGNLTEVVRDACTKCTERAYELAKS